MEGYSLYLNAARAGKHALVLTTVSDHLIRKEYLSADNIRLTKWFLSPWKLLLN